MTEVKSLVNHHAVPLPLNAEGRYYLASPYTADDTQIIQDRVQEMRSLVPEVIKAYPGIVPLVPVTITDPLANSDCTPKGGWYAFGLELLDSAKGIIIVQQEGWEDSRGIMLELGFAIAKGLPIAVLDPNNVVPAMVAEVEEDPETKHGLQESQILEQMEHLKGTGTYKDYSPEQLRERAIEILTDDIPF